MSNHGKKSQVQFRESDMQIACEFFRPGELESAKVLQISLAEIFCLKQKVESTKFLSNFGEFC